MFTPTYGEFLNLHNVSYDDFLVRIGCDHLVGKPRSMVLAYHAFSSSHTQGLLQDRLEMPPPKERQIVANEMDKIVEEIGSDRLPVFQQQCQLMFEQGVQDRVHVRYLVSEDMDYNNYTPRGLFMSLESANKCGARLVERGTSIHNLQLEVMLEQP